jgi:superfamily I DNA/RNA helicase
MHKVPYKEIAILTRTNKNVKDFEPYMLELGIPYELHPNAHKFMQRKEIKVAFAYLLLLGRPNDNFAF